MKISANFSVDEFISSDTSARLGYAFSMGRYERENIGRLVEQCLQPAREAVTLPFVITSGYRPAWLNKHIGGAKDSRHMYGCAVDFVVPLADLTEVFRTIRDLKLNIDQLILEHPQSTRGWIHLGIALPGQIARNQYMIATKSADGRTVYTNA